MTKFIKMNAKLVVMVALLVLALCYRPSMSFVDYSSMRRMNQNNRMIITTKKSKWSCIRKFHSLFATLRSHTSSSPIPPPLPLPPPIQLDSSSFNDFENTELLKRTTSTRQEEEVKVVASVVKAPKKFIPYPFQVSFKIMEVFFWWKMKIIFVCRATLENWTSFI